MLNEFYTDSPENNDSYSLLVNITENIVNNEENVELIDLNENPDIKNKTLKRLREDLRLSNEFLDVVENKTIIQKKIFVQIGFFSQEENALERIKICKNKDINDAFIKKTKSSKNDNYFYRILVGPYNSKEKANDKLIELKEKNIESIIMELNDEWIQYTDDETIQRD